MGLPEGSQVDSTRLAGRSRPGGPQTLYETTVQEVLIEKGKATGVRALSRDGGLEVFADLVVLAAGGLATPVILQRSGFEEAGGGLVVDLYVKTYGLTEGVNLLREPMMALVDDEFHEPRGFVLSPYITRARTTRFVEVGVRGLALRLQRLLAIKDRDR